MNIQIILSKLNESMTDREIGQEIGAAQSIVTRLRNGSHRSTCWERAQAIKQLAERKGIQVPQ